MCGHDHCFPRFNQLFQNHIFKDFLPDMWIEGREGIVDQKDVGIQIKGSSNLDALFLASRQIDSIFADFGEFSGI